MCRPVVESWTGRVVGADRVLVSRTAQCCPRCLWARPVGSAQCSCPRCLWARPVGSGFVIPRKKRTTAPLKKLPEKLPKCVIHIIFPKITMSEEDIAVLKLSTMKRYWYNPMRSSPLLFQRSLRRSFPPWITRGESTSSISSCIEPHREELFLGGVRSPCPTTEEGSSIFGPERAS